MRSLPRSFFMASCMLALACGQSAGVTDAGADAAPELPPTGAVPDHPKSLPFAYTRPEAGTPIDQTTIDQKTDELLDLLTKTRYFGFVDERVHGWPESDPAKHFWYATWPGADVDKTGGVVTYVHGPNGSDNDGIATSPILEGACYAHRLWADARIEHLLRRVIRGLSSWILAMQRRPDDPDTLLTRASYPMSIQSTDSNVAYGIDYSQCRPGLDNGATDYVHIPNNPTWGDEWVKNKRSKDDIGHMFRAIAQIDACDGTFTEPGAEDDLVQLRKLYQAWSRRVEDDGWTIATIDKNDITYLPTDGLAHFISVGTADVECAGKLALRLFGRVTPGDLDCGNGISAIDAAATAGGHSNGQILRSFHEAAAGHALLSNNLSIAQALVEGLGQRLDDMMNGFATNNPEPFLVTIDASDLILFSANVGVPLTWREVAYLHQQIDLAHQTYLDPSNDLIYRTFDPATPDGSYLFRPPGDGINFVSLGAMIGLCSSQWLNPASKPVLNCDKVKAWLPVYTF
jgi:hypothetical protein